ncbi:MAG: class I tRNA ligase family protein [Bacillota bacterium]
MSKAGYDFKAIEAKWRRRWTELGFDRASEDSEAPRFSVIPMFPYPSGKLHMGHVRVYSLTDVIAKYRRRMGFNVLHVMGWDAYGLPAENEAIKKGTHPKQSIAQNIAVMKGQLQEVGIGYDWSREVATCDPSFDHWTQWLFLQLFKAGLAYRARAAVKWCPSCHTTIADEQVIEGRCERCDTPVETRELEQWFFRITAYAQRLYDDVDKLTNWPERIKAMQRHWIGPGRGEDGGFHIRDWLVSRQRYWGAPIPIVYCRECGTVPVPEKELPIILPDDVSFRGQGRSPLADHPTFRHITCPECGGPAERETDTMDTFVPSAWYYLRYTDPHNPRQFAAAERLARWLPLDLYFGGPEHATVHLIYTRFIIKFLHDQGHLPFDEGIDQLFVQGIVRKDGARMSKSKGNAISQDEMVARYGADATRTFALFVAPPEQDVEWSNRGITGITRFLGRVWRLAQAVSGNPLTLGADPADPLEHQVHETIARVTADIEGFRFNTAISTLIELSRAAEQRLAESGPDAVLRRAVQALVELLSPFAPYISDELYQQLGGATSVHQAPWPRYDPSLTGGQSVVIVFQVDGRVRDRAEYRELPDQEQLRRAALASPRVQRALEGRRVAQVIVVPGRLVNIVTS